MNLTLTLLHAVGMKKTQHCHLIGRKFGIVRYLGVSHVTVKLHVY